MVQSAERINKLEYAKVFSNALDQHAIIAATSGWMEANAGQVKYSGGDEVKIPSLSTQGLADYDRDEGFVRGSVTLKWDTYKLTQDRGRTFSLDAMDVDETNFAANAAAVMKQFQAERVIPEIDSYRYSKIAAIAKAAGQSESVDLTAETALSKLREHIRAIQDVIGVESRLIITLTSSVLALIESDPKIQRVINVGNFGQGGMNFTVKTIDDHVLKVVPAARMKTEYDSKDGKTSGQEDGGLTPSAAAKSINWLITPQNVPIAVSKTDKVRIFAPDENQKADAWKLDYRKYHDLWILRQKEKQTFACIATK